MARNRKKVYSKNDYEKDSKEFEQGLKESRVDWSRFKRLVTSDLCQNSIIETESLGEYKLEDIKLALNHPRQNYRVLMGASEYLMKISPHYNKLNKYFSNMAVFNWWVDVFDMKENVNVSTMRKVYFNLSAKLENMNLQHEFKKIMRVLPYQDVYCGLVAENGMDFFFQQVNFSICKLKKIKDGLFNFAINLSMINPTNLGAYPDYVKRAYIEYTEGRADYWYVPPSDKQICIKLNQEWNYPYPLLISLVRDILDLDLYKKLKLQSARTDNYKAIVVEVPIDENAVDKPLLTPDTLGIFAEINKESMTEDIGLIHTLGSKGEAISFKDSSNTRNNVADSTDDIYNSAGVSKELFNGSASGTAVTLSVENDSGIVYDVYRQFERWVNGYIKTNKYNKPQFKFKFFLMDMTIYNKDNVIARYKDACTLGVPVIGEYMACLGKTPSRVQGSFIVQEDIFGFSQKMKPLSTSYTQTDDNTGGRPTNESKGERLSDSGEKTKDLDSNSKR